MAKCNMCGKKIPFLSSKYAFDDQKNYICLECSEVLAKQSEKEYIAAKRRQEAIAKRRRWRR